MSGESSRIPWDAAVIPPFVAATGRLPPGRYRSSIAEVEARLVHAPAFAQSPTRAAVWSDFLAAVDLLRAKRMRIPAAFLAGSFVSDTVAPSDVDATIFFDARMVLRDETVRFAAALTTHALEIGLRVDVFVVPWLPDPGTSVGDPEYLLLRGHWDDFWQRYVPKSERRPPQRAHVLPVRGYLEVIIDDYT